MSSNMLAGERRWASARKGGMMVLGKVAVPKPFNLPSQRLENHGLDHSVEIVPKGTIGWRSRPSSSGSNAWVSSSQSPNADGGNTSPIHRPSSGGSSVTRPSTAASNRTHEAVASAWGSNSRPSSSSGALPSNHLSSSSSLRPRSAETRPNSSQLSKFAEPVSEGSVAWGSNGAAESLGVKSSKGDGFSLSSGDFPTLGTEKGNAVKNFESQDHTLPSSASGRVTSSKEDAKYHADSKSGVVNTWRPDGSQMEADRFHPSMEKWPGEPPPYPNPNIPPQHFHAWRGPPVNAPAGGWYRGPPRGPAFGAPGGFPMEPFPYYRPHIQPPGGPRGSHPKNDEFYHGPPGPPHHGPPHMPEYARPGMPFGPGFYRGPPGPPGSMGFEGYYGQPMGYHNNEWDISYMGMPSGPGANGPPDTDISHGRAGGRAMSGKTMPEHPEADHLKNHKELDWKAEVENWEHSVQPRRNSDWGADEDDAEREISVMKRQPSENSSRNPYYRDRYSNSADLKSFGGMHNVNKSGNPATFPPQMPQQPPLATKDPDLMQKIEGLNAKIRATDGRKDALNAYNNREEQMILSQVVDQKSNSNTGEVIGQAGEDQTHPTVAVSRSSYHGGQGRVDHHGIGKFNNPDDDGWWKKPLTPEFIGAAKASNMESARSLSFVGEPAQKLLVSSVPKVEGESVAEAYDLTDIQAQRTRMRKQRALQLQKEEEERIREQKAKALAKLEELNRRAQTVEAAIEKAEIEKAEKITDVEREEEKSCTKSPSRNPTLVESENTKSKGGKSDEVSVNLPPDAPPTKAGAFESNESFDGHTLPIKENSSGDDRKVAVRSNDVGHSMHKRTVYKQKQNTVLQNSFNEKSVLNSASEAHKSGTSRADFDITLTGAPSSEPRENIVSNVHDTSNTGPTTITTQKKKVNKSGKNKHKLDLNPEKKSIPESKATSANLDGPPVSTVEPEGTQLSSALPSEESQSRLTNNWKPQPVHRMPRSQQAKREKAHGSEVIWAPVRAHNKADDSVEAIEKSTLVSTSLTKSDTVARNNNFKGKRAEMERYVPKPVANELAQQGSVPLSSFSISSSRSDEVPMVQFGSISFESTQNVSSTNVSVTISEVKEGDGRHSKHKKDQHGHWRQRGTGPSPIHEPTKGTQQQIEHAQAQLVMSDIINSENSEINAYVKDHVATGRGKRCTPGPSPRRTGNNSDHENTFSAERDGSSVQLAAPDVNYNERNDVRGHRGTGEQTSHWKPKSNTYSKNNQHIDKPGGNQTVMTTEINKLPKKKVHPSQHKVQEESSNIDNSLHDSNVAEDSMPVHHHQGFNREKKPFPAKGRSNFPNPDPIVRGDSVSTGNTSDFRRNGGQSNRYARGNEFYGDRPSGQDNRPHNVQRQNVHEYQPVGPTKGGNLE